MCKRCRAALQMLNRMDREEHLEHHSHLMSPLPFYWRHEDNEGHPVAAHEAAIHRRVSHKPIIFDPAGMSREGRFYKRSIPTYDDEPDDDDEEEEEETDEETDDVNNFAVQPPPRRDFYRDYPLQLVFDIPGGI